MTTLAATEPKVTRPGWNRCLSGWECKLAIDATGYVSPTHHGRYTWTIIGHRPLSEPIRSSRGNSWVIAEAEELPGGKKQTYETPDEAAEACERAREAM